MLTKIILTAGLITIAALSQCQTAYADDVTDAINQANELVREGEARYKNELAPALKQQEEYLQQLHNACVQGNNQACDEVTEFYRRQNERLDRVLQWQRQRMGR